MIPEFSPHTPAARPPARRTRRLLSGPVLTCVFGLVACWSTPAVAAQQEALDSLRAAFDLPGLSVAVVSRSGDLETFVSGIAAADTPATPDAMFEVGSVTKTYTAALVLRLAERGALDLDAPLARWKPDFPHVEGVTLRHLLQHTSGLFNPSEDPRYLPALRGDFTARWRPDDSYAFMAEPYFPPGEGWHYSNANYLLLGEVVEAVTGTSWAAALRAEVLEPVGLAHTFVDASEEVRGERAHAFVDIDGDGSPEDLTALVPNTSFVTSAWSAGAVIATAADLARWGHALLGGAFLSEETHAAMTTWVERGDGMQYGLGVLRYTSDDGRELLGHKGNTAGYSAGLWHDPARGLTVAVLSNGHLVDVTPIALALLEAMEAR